MLRGMSLGTTLRDPLGKSVVTMVLSRLGTQNSKTFEVKKKSSFFPSSKDVKKMEKCLTGIFLLFEGALFLGPVYFRSN